VVKIFRSYLGTSFVHLYDIYHFLYIKGKVKAETEIFGVAFNCKQFIAVFVIKVHTVKVGQTNTRM